MRRVPIRFGNLATVLRLLGSMYRNPADALKEHISNAIDEHLRARVAGNGQPVCRVLFTMRQDAITIEYSYGMAEEEFRAVLQRVANSAKKDLDFAQIGQLGIGMFSFFQIGKKCTFISQKAQGEEPVKVTIREGSDSAEFERVKKSECLAEPGIKIIIAGLRLDPTQKRGPLSKAKLQKIFAEKFNSYLRDGTLEIVIREPRETYQIESLQIDLPRIGQGYENWYLPGTQKRKISLELYFDLSGKGAVSIRHTGVTIVENISEVHAYGLEESVYASGTLRGFIDADFLTPLPARIGFEENKEWLAFLAELDRIRPAIEAEIELLKEKEAQERLTEIQRKAIEMAKEILDSEEFQDMELLEGLGERRKAPEPRLPPNGFDFVPTSVRINPGKMGAIPFKAVVPRMVPNETVVRFSIDNPSIQILPKRVILKGVDADENGVVTVRISLFSRKQTDVPAILTAKAEGFEALAHVRVAEATQTREGGGAGINYEEKPFEEGPQRHSRFVPGLIQINTLNPDYREAMQGTDEEKMVYAALMIGKETFAFNDKSGITDEFLEKLLTFLFQARRKMKK